MKKSFFHVKRALVFSFVILLVAGAIYAASVIATREKPQNDEVDMCSQYAEKLKSDEVVIYSGRLCVAMTGSLDYKKNTILALKAAVKSGADAVEMNVAFDGDGNAFLADSPEEINADTVPLDKAIEAVLESDYNPDVKIVFNLMDTSGMKNFKRYIRVYNLVNRSYIVGVNSDNLELVRNNCDGVPYYYDIEYSRMYSQKKKESIIDSAKKVSAIGIRVDSDCADKDLFDIVVQRSGLRIMAYGAENLDDVDRLLRCGIVQIATKSPEDLVKLFDMVSN